MIHKISSVIYKYAWRQTNAYTPITKEVLEDIYVCIPERERERYVYSLINYVETILKESYEYETLLLAIQMLTDSLEKMMVTETRAFDGAMYNLFTTLKCRLGFERVRDMTSDATKILQVCELHFQDFYVKYVDSIRDIDEDYRMFEFLLKIITETGDVLAIQKILARKPDYVNLLNRNGRSLFYKVAHKYILTRDSKYLRFLVVFLENPHFKFDSSEVLGLFESLEMNPRLQGKYGPLLTILKHYFKIDSDGELEFKNSFQVVAEKPLHEMTHHNNDGRIDLSSLRTISFEKYGENSTYGIDNYYTYSLEVDKDGFYLYYHFPDIDEYVETDSSADERAKHLMESFCYNKRAIHLFDQETLDNVRYSEGEKKKAITFRVHIGKNGNVKELSVFPSVVSLDKSYTSKYIAKAKGNNREINSYDAISSLFRRQGETYTSMGRIVEPLTELIESCVHCLGEGKIPFIYRNVLSRLSIEKYLNRARTLDIVDEYWDANKNKFYRNTIGEKKDEVVVYSTELLRCPLKDIRTVPITNPEMSYVALENLRLVKDHLRRQFGSGAGIYSVGLVYRSSKFVRSGATDSEVMLEDGGTAEVGCVRDMDEWKKRLVCEAIVASTVGREYYMNNVDVKRLLHNI